MTVQDVTNYIEYTGDGVQTSFAFNFRADEVSWVILSFNDDLDAVNLNADQIASPGGTVDFLVAPPSGQELKIERSTPQVQDLDYGRYGPFDDEASENMYDKIVMMIQDLNQYVLDEFVRVDALIDALSDTILAGFNWVFVDFTGDRTLQLTDAHRMLRALDNGGTQTVTVPPNSEVDFDIGTQISLRQLGTSTLSVAAGAGVTIDTPSTLDVYAQNGTITLIQEETDRWSLAGNLAP